MKGFCLFTTNPLCQKSSSKPKRKEKKKIVTLKKNEEFIGITLNNSRRNVFVIRENTLTPPPSPGTWAHWERVESPSLNKNPHLLQDGCSRPCPMESRSKYFPSAKNKSPFQPHFYRQNPLFCFPCVLLYFMGCLRCSGLKQQRGEGEKEGRMSSSKCQAGECQDSWAWELVPKEGTGVAGSLGALPHLSGFF